MWKRTSELKSLAIGIWPSSILILHIDIDGYVYHATILHSRVWPSSLSSTRVHVHYPGSMPYQYTWLQQVCIDIACQRAPLHGWSIAIYCIEQYQEARSNDGVRIDTRVHAHVHDNGRDNIIILLCQIAIIDSTVACYRYWSIACYLISRNGVLCWSPPIHTVKYDRVEYATSS